MSIREHTFADKVIGVVDTFLRHAAQTPSSSSDGRKSPAQPVQDDNLSPEQRKHSAALMRVNHAGEVAAQALYKGQAFVARQPEVSARMQEAAKEEEDHLVWCSQRLVELNSHTSYLDPVWFMGSFAIGIAAGLAGDKWSLGFIAETEDQVIAHLNDHLKQLPADDQKSRAILEQMREDEAHHGHMAMECGGEVLPSLVRRAMQIPAKIMTTLAYYW